MRDPFLLRAAAILSALCLLFNLVRAQDQDPTSGFDVFTTPTNNQEIPAGSNFDIIWVPSTPAGPVSIVLMQGGSELDQEDGPTIASGIDSTSGKYTWSVPSSYGGFPSYGFRLQLDADPNTFQYSYAFRIQKDPNAPTSSTSASSNRAHSSSTVTPAPATGNPQDASSSSAEAYTTGSPIKSSSLPSATSQATSFGSSSVSSGTAPLTTTSAQSNQPSSTPSASASTSAGSSQSGGSSSTVDSNLSTAAKVGIAVGGGTALCIIIILAGIVLLMRRKHKLQRKSAEDPEPTEDDKSVESKGYKISELESAMASEIMSEMRLELDGRGRVGELAGSDLAGYDDFEKGPRGKGKTLGVIYELHEMP